MIETGPFKMIAYTPEGAKYVSESILKFVDSLPDSPELIHMFNPNNEAYKEWVYQVLRLVNKETGDSTQLNDRAMTIRIPSPAAIFDKLTFNTAPGLLSKFMPRFNSNWNKNQWEKGLVHLNEAESS